MDWTWIDRGFYFAVGCALFLCLSGILFLALSIACGWIVEKIALRRWRTACREANRLFVPGRRMKRGA
jgi:hypothetical protein